MSTSYFILLALTIGIVTGLPLIVALYEDLGADR